MRTKSASILLLLSAVAVSIAGVINERPSASYRDGKIVVRWNTADETGVRKFDVMRAQRKEGTQDVFIVVMSVAAVGQPSEYTYTDESVFKVNSGLFVYKVRVWFENGSFSDSEVSYPAAALSSAAKRTWGSIKAMFR